MKKDLQNLTQKDENKIQNWQNQIDDIENYQKNGISYSKQRKTNS